MNILKSPVTLTIVLILGTMIVSAQSSKMEKKFNAINTEASKVYAEKDFVKYAKFYAKDGQLLQPNGETVSGRNNIEKYWEDVYKQGVTKIENAILEIGGKGKTYYEIGSYKAYNAKGELIGEGKHIVIWKKVKGDWVRSRDIWNSNRPAN